MRHQLSPGVTYSHRSTLSFPAQPVVGRGAQSVQIKEALPVSKPSTSSLGAGDIANRVRAAVKDSRIQPSETDRWTELLAEDPSYADLLEQLVSVPEVTANRQTIESALSAGPASVPKYTNLSAGDYRQHLPANAPKLFDSGDLPVMTASGIDVDLLRKVPWQARPALARAKTYAEAHELVSKYSGENGQIQADFDAVSGGDLFGDVAEYEDRLEAWGTWEATDAEARQLTGGPSDLMKRQMEQFAEVNKSRKAQGNPGDHFPFNTDPLNVFTRRNGNYQRWGGK